MPYDLREGLRKDLTRPQLGDIVMTNPECAGPYPFAGVLTCPKCGENKWYYLNQEINPNQMAELRCAYCVNKYGPDNPSWRND